MEKIKQFIGSEQGNTILIVIIVILVGLASFELGRLSKDSTSTGVKVSYEDVQTNTDSPTENTVKNIPTNKTSSTGQNFFASNRGSKYYSVGCSGGNTIKQENRIYFNTSAEAEQAGYTLSTSCK